MITFAPEFEKNNFMRRSILILIAIILFQCSSFAQHQELFEKHDVAAETMKHEDKEQVENHDAHNEKYDPAKMILHHIGDSHEFVIWGEKSVSLPVMIWNRKEGKFITGMSCCFKGEGKDGFVMEHGKIVSKEGLHFPDIIDFSITKNVFTLLLGALFMIVIFLYIASLYKNNKNKAPKGIQSFFEPIIEFIRDEVAKPSIGKHYNKYMPFLLSAFFFIWFLNMIGQVPVFPFSGNVTGNIAFTAGMALISFIIINISGNKGYWHHIVAMPGVPLPLLPMITFLELLGLIIKPFALAMRLFANIMAGHILILSLISLVFIFGNAPTLHHPGSWGGSTIGAVVSVIFTLFIMLIELLVAILQAFIFTMLTATFIGAAVEETDGHGHH